MKKTTVFLLSINLIILLTACGKDSTPRDNFYDENQTNDVSYEDTYYDENNEYEDEFQDEYQDDNIDNQEPIIGYWLASDGTGVAITNSSMRIYSPFNGTLIKEKDFTVTSPMTFGYDDDGNQFQMNYESNEYNFISVQNGYFNDDGKYIEKGENEVLVFGLNVVQPEGHGWHIFFRVDSENMLKGSKSGNFTAKEENLFLKAYGIRKSIYYELKDEVHIAKNKIYITYANNRDKITKDKDFEKWEYSKKTIDYRFFYVDDRSADYTQYGIITSDNQYLYFNISSENEALGFPCEGLSTVVKNGGTKSYQEYLDTLKTVLN